jgi:hypothetical protein
VNSLDFAGHRAVQWAAIGSMALLLGVGGCSASSGGTAPPAQPAPPSSAIPTTPFSSPTASATASAFKQDAVDTAFANKLGALCNEWNIFASNHPYPGVANPQAATVEELPKIGAWIDSLPINHELLAKATALGTPTTGRGSWAHVLEDFASYEKAVGAAATAAKSGGLQAWQSAEASWSAARDAVREDLLKVGIGGQSNCTLPFIRPANH